MTVLCVIADFLTTQSVYSQLAKCETLELVFLTVTRGKENGCPETTLRLRFYLPSSDT
jgi:hypothetical protein